MAQTPFGQVAGPRLTTDSLDRGQVLKLVNRAGWRRAPEVTVPPIPPADESFMAEVAQALLDLYPPRPGCRFAVEYMDTTGDGDGDTVMFGFKCSF